MFKKFLHWTILLPIIATLFYVFGGLGMGSLFQILGAGLLIGSILASVHHAEVVAERVGEPFGTIILAISITVLEVGLIISLMISGGDSAITYARDTVFAAVMLILNGILGICIVIGSIRYKEQYFIKNSTTAYLVSIVAILVFTLILPNFTSSQKGPFYSPPQLIFISLACLIIYSTFLMVQTVRHREYFIHEEETRKESITESHLKKPNRGVAYISFIFLILCLGIVILMSKGISPAIEKAVASLGAPHSLVGVIIALVVLMPECLAAIQAAHKNRFQSSLNLGLGSALASIGLTIPAVAMVCLYLKIPLALGLDAKSIILLILSVFILMISLSRGKTNILYGIVLLVNLAAYIFTVIFP